MSPRFTNCALRFSLAIGIVLAISPSPTQASAARMTSANLGALMAKSLVGMRSVQVVNDSISTHAATSPGGVMKLHMVMVFVRQAKGFTMSMQSIVNGKQVAFVYTGTHACVRQDLHGAWNCNLPFSYVKGYLANMDPVQAMKDSGTIIAGIAAVGAKTIQGQACNGYSFTTTLSSVHYHGRGVIWFSSSTGRLVEATSVGSMTVVAGSAAMMTTGTVVHSRWNDPTLKLPAVPVS